MLQPTRELILDPNLEWPRFTDLDLHFHRVCATPSDINRHLPLLRELVRQESGMAITEVVEFGMRNVVSTWALAAGRPYSLVSVDIQDPPADALSEVVRCTAEEGVQFTFLRCDTLALPPVSCDILFIDTLHTAAQLRAELARHADGVRRFIALHDTDSFGYRGEDGSEPGLVSVIEEFVGERGAWGVEWHDPDCNGLTVLQRYDA